MGRAGRGVAGVLSAAALAVTLGACGEQDGFRAAPAPQVSTATATVTATATATATETATVTVTEIATVVAEVTATVTAPAPSVRGFAGTGGQQKATPKPAPKPANVYYQNCTDVRAHGAAPIRRGEPGYGPHLDRDGDGVGCE